MTGLTALGSVAAAHLGRLTAADAPPLDIGREEAARAAQEELERAIYRDEEAGLVSRAIDWIFTRLSELLGNLLDNAVGGRWWLVALAAVVLALIVVILIRVGLPQRGAARGSVQVFDDVVRTAAEHRAAADTAARQGQWATACRERFRALVRELEERTILDERPGRTADEVAREVGGNAPEASDPLARAAGVFDEVCYGNRTATGADDETIRHADDVCRRLRASALLGTGAP